MDKQTRQIGTEQLEQTVRAEDLANQNEIEIDGPVHAKQNHKLDNSKNRNEEMMESG
ncbi:hypothetical protein [Paenibacillus mesophilus]|uniref:hypothetical protein n=1 Tax=Paenibacillus mesophilus TaxID=2582849 RepID=UPI0013052D23|nr:hypothetical protein [Paenibacillus mesophilus]